MAARIEKDALGRRAVPRNAYYGIFTVRARENFQLSSRRVPRVFWDALVHVKIAAAQANAKLGVLDKKKAGAIERAGKEALRGEFDDHMVLDVFQAGAGTPYNMNVNEVLANRATVLMGGHKGAYKVHPNDDVNMGQSTNDVVPTATRVAALMLLPGFLHEARELERALKRQARRFARVKKSARTHLQDAVPTTLGNNFHAWAAGLARARLRVEENFLPLQDVPLGGTAAGTGLNAHKRYASVAARELAVGTGVRVKPMKDPQAGMQFGGDFISAHGALSRFAVALGKVCDDLRLLSSGPNTGLNEVVLPEVEPGSSIMPGKINPSIPEAANMACFAVRGNQTTVELASSRGELELNVFFPVVAGALLESMEVLANTCNMVKGKCVQGIQANKEVLKDYFHNSLGLVTILNPYIGYAAASKLAKESNRTGVAVPELILKKGLMSKKELDSLLRLENVTKPNLKTNKKSR